MGVPRVKALMSPWRCEIHREPCAATTKRCAHWTGAVDPESLDPFNPGPLPCYTVLNPADIWDPIRAPKATVLYGAMYYGCDVVGVVELKVGKIKNYQAKVSGTVTVE